MNIDAAIIATMSVFVGGHLIAFLIKQGETNQWKKDIESRLLDAETSLDKMREIHTLEKLNSQKLSQMSSDFKEHKIQTEKQFQSIADKIDKSTERLVDQMLNLMKK